MLGGPVTPEWGLQALEARGLAWDVAPDGVGQGLGTVTAQWLT